MTSRSLTLLIAVLSTLATFASVLTGPNAFYHLTNPQALLVAAFGAGAYALVRSLQKVKAGTPWKALLATSELQGAAVVYVSSIASAIAGVVPVQHAGLASGVATALLVLARQLQKPSGGSPTGGTPGGGSGVGPIPTVGLVLGFVFLGTQGKAFAQTVEPAVAPVVQPASAKPAQAPQLGFCNTTRTLCLQPAVAVSAVQVNLVTGDYQRIALNVGYGAVYKGLAVNVGVAVYGGVGLSANSPNAAQGNLLFSIADFGAFGPGFQTFRDPTTDKRIWQGLFTVALNYNLGGSVTYLEKLLAGMAASPSAVP